jgi:monothiol glutaredoxin
MSLSPDTRKRIDEIVAGNRVVLFMKGSRGFPQCGFSAQVVSILDRFVPEYRTVDVLQDPEIREGVKEYSSWPTIPQLYVAGEFLGGCDIITEMFQTGELEQKLAGGAASSR